MPHTHTHFQIAINYYIMRSYLCLYIRNDLPMHCIHFHHPISQVQGRERITREGAFNLFTSSRRLRELACSTISANYAAACPVRVYVCVYMCIIICNVRRNSRRMPFTLVSRATCVCDTLIASESLIHEDRNGSNKK